MTTGAHRSPFLEEVWLTPLQIARRFGYATEKPVRKAIMRGELQATRGPCGRKLLVAETEVERWITSTLAFEPRLGEHDHSTRADAKPTHSTRRSAMPRLRYEAERRPSA
jgi:hypothetical protein